MFTSIARIPIMAPNLENSVLLINALSISPAEVCKRLLRPGRLCLWTADGTHLPSSNLLLCGQDILFIHFTLLFNVGLKTQLLVNFF